MNALIVIFLILIAVSGSGVSIGAAMTYQEKGRRADGRGAFICAGLALLAAFLAGMNV